MWGGVLLDGETSMTEDRPPYQKFRMRSPRRAVLLASVAVITVAVVLGGFELAHYSALAEWIPSKQASKAMQAVKTVAVEHTGGIDQPVGFADIVAKVKPAVVAVRVKIEENSNPNRLGQNNNQVPLPFEKFFRQFENPNGRVVITGEGSGFFISADGYAVTNNHVVDHAKSVKVTTNDGKTYDAKVIGTDPKTDLALIKVSSDKSFPYVKFAEHIPRIGNWVLAVGNPFGLGGTVTAGIISARGRDIGSSPYDDFIQIDASVNKGNSGGPAFNVNGNVIGVTTAIYSPSGGSVGIGFAIPADTVNMVVAQLKDKGFVTRGWIGVNIQPVTADIANSLGLKKAEGALVADRQKDGPAAKAGIKAGDVITTINGEDVKNSRDLAQKIAAITPGQSVTLGIWRNNETKTLTVTLGELPETHSASANNGGPTQVPQLGLTLAPAAEVAGAGSKGVAVIDVDPSGVAADHGFQTGEVILDVGGKAVNSPDDVGNALRTARADGKRTVLMRVKSGDTTLFVGLPLRQG
jgi:serine protease Do